MVAYPNYCLNALAQLGETGEDLANRQMRYIQLFHPIDHQLDDPFRMLDFQSANLDIDLGPLFAKPRDRSSCLMRVPAVTIGDDTDVAADSSTRCKGPDCLR